MNSILLRFASLIACTSLVFSAQLPDLPAIQDPLSSTDQVLAAQLASSVSNTEWLGVLAPIAISPFFGITCLAGMSQFGGEFLGTNSFVSSNPVLNNPAVFWIFLGLTVLTSLPRLTKVSKPMAQALDQVETYSGIITLLIVRFMANSDAAAVPEQVVLQMGALSFTMDMLMSIAAVINIVVINSVKFFFEILIWLTPFPFVDAVLEASNKALCAGLLAIYAFSPLVATIINLVMFLVCLLAFFWIHRRVTYMRTVLFDPAWALINRQYRVPSKPELVVFPTSGFKSIPAMAKVIIQPTENGWKAIRRRLIFKAVTEDISNLNQIEIKRGILWNRLVVEGPDGGMFYFSRRYGDNLDEFAATMKFKFDKAIEPETDLNIA